MCSVGETEHRLSASASSARSEEQRLPNPIILPRDGMSLLARDPRITSASAPVSARHLVFYSPAIDRVQDRTGLDSGHARVPTAGAGASQSGATAGNPYGRRSAAHAHGRAHRRACGGDHAAGQQCRTSGAPVQHCKLTARSCTSLKRRIILHLIPAPCPCLSRATLLHRTRSVLSKNALRCRRRTGVQRSHGEFEI